MYGARRRRRRRAADLFISLARLAMLEKVRSERCWLVPSRFQLAGSRTSHRVIAFTLLLNEKNDEAAIFPY